MRSTLSKSKLEVGKYMKIMENISLQDGVNLGICLQLSFTMRQ